MSGANKGQPQSSGSASRWWWTVFTAVGWFLWPTVNVALEYEPPYMPDVVRRDPPDSFVVCFAWLNVRLKVGRRLRQNAAGEWRRGSDIPHPGLVGRFVTAKLRGDISPRQGWVICVDPLIIRGESGTLYECEGEPTIVVNPPNDKRETRREAP